MTIQMKEVFILSGVYMDGERKVLSVNATAEGVDKELKKYMADGSAYSEIHIETWGIGE